MRWPTAVTLALASSCFALREDPNHTFPQSAYAQSAAENPLRYLDQGHYETTFAYLMEHSELFRQAYINVQQRTERRSVGDDAFEVVLHTASRLDRDRLVRNLFALEVLHNGTCLEGGLTYRGFDSIVDFLNQRRKALNVLSPDVNRAAGGLVDAYRGLDGTEGPWRFVDPDNFNPNFSDSRKNPADLYIEQMFGEVPTTPEERRFASCLIQGRQESVRGYIDATQSAMDRAEYRVFESTESRPITDVFGDGGNCVDFADSFAKIFDLSKGRDPRLNHTHVVPTIVYRKDRQWNGSYQVNGHRIVTVIQTDIRQVTFHDPTGGSISDLRTFISQQ